MKKNWKLIVGIILLIGGYGCIMSDAEVAALGVVAGIVLIAWWVVGRKRMTAKAAQTNVPTPSSERLAAQIMPQPQQAPEGKKIAKATQSGTSDPSSGKLAEKMTPQLQKEPVKYDVLIPERKDGASIAYRYSVSFVPTNPDVVLSAAKAERWYLTAQQIGHDTHLFSEGIDLGILTERTDMISDWQKRGDPYLIILERVNSETGCKIMLVFYRDKQKHYAHKEQTLIPLTGYKAESKQNTILCLAPGDELEAEEDFDKEGRVTVSYSGDVIGNLPKKYADRFIEEGAALVVFDHGEDSEDGLITKPVVRVYW